MICAVVLFCEFSLTLVMSMSCLFIKTQQGTTIYFLILLMTMSLLVQVPNFIYSAAFNTYVKERTNEILNFNNAIASLQKQLERAEAKRLRVQMEMDGSIRSASEKTLELGMILMAVSNLLQRATCQDHGVNIKHRKKVCRCSISFLYLLAASFA